MITAIIRKLPVPAEFCLVVLVCFWWGLFGSFKEIAKQLSSTPHQPPEQHTGIGVELGYRDDKIIIVQILPRTSAAAAGLARGVVIQKIGGVATAGKSLEDCARMLGGAAESRVTLELVDHGKTKPVEVARRMFEGSPKPHFPNWRALVLVGFELVGLAVMFWIARVRRWPLGAWGFKASWKLTGAGMLLWAVMALVIVGFTVLANFISPGLLHEHFVSDMSLPVLILFAITNGVFEETLESGYFIQTLQGNGMGTAVLASACFRTFLHAYLGVGVALIIILPFGLVFGFIYWKWRRLWPLFVAHTIFDFIAYIA